MNFVGALLGQQVANTVSEVIDPPDRQRRAGGRARRAARARSRWNLITWYFGLPSSSSHALIGGLVGAALAAGVPSVHWTTILDKVVIPMVLSPVVGFMRRRSW